MKAVRWVFIWGTTLVWSLAAHSAPVYGVAAFVATDAGAAHTHQNVPFDAVSNVSTTGVITQALADNQYFGAQFAATSAYASVGALGGKVRASSTFGSSPSGGQASNDLSWYFHWTPTGIAGTTIQVMFSELYEGLVAGAGMGFSGGTHATTFVGGTVFSDNDFNSLINPGPFSILTSRIYEFTVGQTVYLTSRLTVGGRAELNSSIEIDAFNTSKFFVDVLTPGAGYNSGDFLFPTLLTPPDPTPTPVPEPSMLTLFGLALCGVARSLRKRR